MDDAIIQKLKAVTKDWDEAKCNNTGCDKCILHKSVITENEDCERLEIDICDILASLDRAFKNRGDDE